MNGMQVSHELLEARQRALDDRLNPVRRHEPDGIGVPDLGTCVPEMGTQHQETYNLALEFLSDIASPEGYGHAVNPEVVKRAVRILATLRPKGYVAPREGQE